MSLATDSIYGLAAAAWTRDIGAAHRLSRPIRAGAVWVNTYDPSSLAIDKHMDFKTIWTHYR